MASLSKTMWKIAGELLLCILILTLRTLVFFSFLKPDHKEVYSNSIYRNFTSKSDVLLFFWTVRRFKFVPELIILKSINNCFVVVFRCG